MYKVDSFRRFRHWGLPIQQHVLWETDGIIGNEKVFTAIPIPDPSSNPREPWSEGDLVTVEREWTAKEAEGLATKLSE
jgi:hypothetical protein